MPSSQTRIYDLEKKIQDLEVRAQSQGLSTEAELHLRFLRKWRELAGRDVVLVIRPRGVIERPGEKAKARLVEVHDEVAADLLVFGPRRGEAVRIATPEEVQLFRDYEEANKAAHRKQIAGAQARTAVEGVNALLGQLASAAAGGAPAQMAPPPPPDVEVIDEATAVAQEAETLVPELPVSPSAPMAESVADAAAKQDAATDGGLDADMAKLGTPKCVKALIEAGYVKVEQVAEADQARLIEVPGIGPAIASQIMVQAAEIMAQRGEESRAPENAET